MAVLIYAESENGKFKKVTYELASYGRAIADKLRVSLLAITFNQEENESLGNYGVEKVCKIKDDSLEKFTLVQYANNIANVAEQNNVQMVVLSSNANAKYLAPELSVLLSAGYASNVVALPEHMNPLVVKRSCFTNKAFNITSLRSSVNILGLSNNSYGIHESPKKLTMLEQKAVQVPSSFTVNGVEKSNDTVSIADADIVVSGGRGLKGPENWHLIEDLATTLGAATACSKPVSDMGWRPHSEHVGQTGKPVASNLYIAIGVSGAIQHLAGISSSKIKVVINNDPEAPFFKAADYGVVGDAFEVVPELIEKLKAFKNS